MEQTHLTGGEWNVLSCLWEKSPQTLMQLVVALGERVGWAKSTTITTLRRMEGKGLVRCESTAKGKTYTPLVAQENATRTETRSFLDRVYHGSIGLMVSSMAQRQELSEEDLAALREILKNAEGEHHD